MNIQKAMPIRMRSLLLCLIILAAMLCPIQVLAEDAESKVVRVGYVNAENYEEGGEGEYKRGFGYEYFQKISSITGWEYEYVHGSFAECYDKLVNGEIDLFGNVSYKADRAELMYFSDYPEGKDTYWLYAGEHRSDLLSKDTGKLNGCKIGVTRGSFQEGLLNEWISEKEIQAEVVTCDGFEEMMKRLDEEELDAIAAPDLSTNYGYKIITMLGTSDYYFAVSKKRPDILEELNEALYEIQTAEPEYNSLLVNRYNYKVASGLIMNEEEERWIEEHDRTIRMGCYADYLPFIGERDGQYIGVITTVIDTLKREYNVDVELTTYADFDAMKTALRGGEIDLIGPVVGDFYLAEQDKFVLTETIVETTPVVFYKNNDMNNPNRVVAATSQSVFNPDIIQVLFPDAEIMICESTDDCLEAVDKGSARATVIPAARINIVRRNPLTETMFVAEVSDRFGIRLLASKKNRRAATIVNKAILHSNVELNGMVMAENADSGKTASLVEILKRYTMPILAVIGIVLLVLLYLSVSLGRNRIKLEKALETSKTTNDKLKNQQHELEVLAAEAQLANQAKTNFLFSMSHDIRTPMNAIIGFTELLRRHLDDREAAEQYIEKIENSNDFLLSLINNVLEMARIESGKECLEEVVCNAEAFIQSLYSVFEGQFREKNIRFTGNMDVKHEEFWADDTKLGEVLLNIMSNAAKYTLEGGAICFTLTELPSERPGYAVMETVIEDTGIGMSEEFLPHLFDEFSREQSSTASGVIGTGLGMSIVKKLVTLMGGEIFVESALGIGTKFTLRIPHRIADTVRGRVAENDIKSYGREIFDGKRLLMAEDNELNAEIAISILEEEGFRVDRAEDGSQCVEMLDNAPAGYYDLILMDVQMPNMDGYQATKTIRKLADPEKANIPIVAMTANAFEEDRKNAFKAGMNAHLAKPIQVDILKSTLGHILSSETISGDYFRDWRDRFFECEEFSEFEEKYRVMGIPCGFLVYEAAGEGTILYADETLLGIFGCSSFAEFMEYSGGSFKRMVHPDDIDRVENEISEQIKKSTRNIDQVQYRITRKDGKVLHVDDIGRKLYIQNGKAVYYVFVVDVNPA